VRLLRLVTVGPTTKKASSDNACYGCYGSRPGVQQAFSPKKASSDNACYVVTVPGPGCSKHSAQKKPPSMEQNTAIPPKLQKRYRNLLRHTATIPTSNRPNYPSNPSRTNPRRRASSSALTPTTGPVAPPKTAPPPPTAPSPLGIPPLSEKRPRTAFRPNVSAR